MAGSTFNLRNCSNAGGYASGSGGCGLNVTVPSDAIGSTEETAAEIASRAEEILRNSIGTGISDHLKSNGVNSSRIAFDVTLTYECPKVGDVVRWDRKNKRYEKAYAKFDLTPGVSDPEHLTEVIGVVESVSTSCNGDPITPQGIESNATIVMFGHINFKNIDLDAPQLEEGTTYFLWDKTFTDEVSFGSNLSRKEPVISKPVLYAKDKQSGIVLHYRAMTGSSSGGQTEIERYEIRLTLIKGGWNVEIENVGNMSSRFPLVAELHYNRLLGGDNYVMYKTIGSLKSKEQSIVLGDDSNMAKFEATKFSTQFGIASGSAPIRENGINGVGELFIRLKTTNGDSFNPNNPIVSQVPVATSDVVRSIPNLAITPSCAQQDQPDIKNIVTGQDGIVSEDLTEGAMYEIRIIDGVGGEANETPLGFTIDMTGDLYAQMSWANEDTSKPDHTVNTNFKLPSNEDIAVELFPVDDINQGIIETEVTLRFVTRDGLELPSNHWAQYLTQSNYPITCDDDICCGGGKAIINANSGSVVSISELLTDGDSSLFNNNENAKLYTMSSDSNIIWPTGSKPEDALEVSWKNVREDVQICYPATVKSGTEPAFMTIYANEARQFVSNQDMDQFDYDPRYIIAEIGANETLNGKIVKLTLNKSTSRSECCLSIRFNGSLQGTHYTISELCEKGLLSNTTIGCSQAC